MPDPFVISRIQHLPLFQLLSREELEQLSDAFQVLRLAPETVIFHQGQPSQGLYVFVYGSAVLSQTNANGSTRPIGMLEAGQYINENALFMPMNESATLKVVEPSVVLLLTRTSLKALIAQMPHMGAALNAYLSGRNRAGDAPPAPPLVKPAPPPAPTVAPAPSSGLPLVQPAPIVQPPPAPAVQPVQPSSGLPLVQPAPIVQNTPVTQPNPAAASQVVQAPPASIVQNPPVAPNPLPATPITAPATQRSAPTTPMAQPVAAPVITQPPVPAAPVASVPSPIAQANMGQGASMPLPSITDLSITFDGQRETEVVLGQYWRHWWAFARFAWAPLLIMIGLFILTFVVPVPFLQFAFGVAAILFPGVVLLYLYREWRNDRLIVTTERVVWIERKLIPPESTMRDVPIESILEVAIDLPKLDPFAQLLNYGNVILRTSGGTGNLTLDLMPEPLALQKLVFSSRDQHKQVLDRQQRNVIRSEVNQLIEGKDPKKAMTHTPPPLSGGFNPLATNYINTKGETVYRKHWSVWLGHTILPLLLMFVGVLIGLWALNREGNLRLFAMSMSALPIVLGGVWLYFSDWDWRNDLYIVGDDRVTLIHQRPFWMENKIDTISLAQVNSVATDQQGLLNMFLNRGDVRLSLEGVENLKKFEDVSNPRGVAAEISTRQAHARQKLQASQVHQQQQAVADYLSVYHETVNQSPNTGQPYRPPAGQQLIPTTRPTDANRPPNVPKQNG
jgi:hypothetical protein